MSNKYKFLSVFSSIMILFLLFQCNIKKYVPYSFCENDNIYKIDILWTSKNVFDKSPTTYGIYINEPDLAVDFSFFTQRFSKRIINKINFDMLIYTPNTSNKYNKKLEIKMILDSIKVISSKDIKYNLSKISEGKYIARYKHLNFEGFLKEKMTFRQFKEYIHNETLTFLDIRYIDAQGDTITLEPITFRAIRNCEDLE